MEIEYVHRALLMTKTENRQDSREMQLDRALDYESRGREFESSRARQTFANHDCLLLLGIDSF